MSESTITFQIDDRITSGQTPTRSTPNFYLVNTYLINGLLLDILIIAIIALSSCEGVSILTRNHEL